MWRHKRTVLKIDTLISTSDSVTSWFFKDRIKNISCFFFVFFLKEHTFTNNKYRNASDSGTVINSVVESFVSP